MRSVFERLIFGADHIEGVFIGFAEFRRLFDVVGAEGAGLLADMGDIAFFKDFHS